MMTRQPLNGKVRLLRPADSLDELAQHVNGAFVWSWCHRRQISKALLPHSGIRGAGSQERPGAGHKAKVFLAELKPLWRLEGGVSS